MTPNKLQEFAGDFLEQARRQDASVETEVYLVRGEERAVELQDNRLERILEMDYEGVGLRVLREGRQGFAWSAHLDPGQFSDLWPRAVSQLAFVASDPHRALPRPSKERKDDPSELARSLYDDSLFAKPLESWVAPLQEAGQYARREHASVKRILETSYGEDRTEVLIANSHGISAFEKGSSAGFSICALAEAEGETELGSSGMSARFTKDLDFRSIGREAGARAAALAGARKLPAGRRAVLFDPWVSSEFLEMFEDALCADKIQRGKSMLGGRRGERVASKNITLVDDPRRLHGVSSRLFDGEGLATRSKTLVDHGILRDYFYDTYSANKEGRASNACAGRSSFRGVPSPSSSNFIMLPGTMTREALIQDTRDGILVLEAMGMHTADSISGEFSVAISGMHIQNGELAGGIKNAMISGNILEVLRSVDAVADDLKCYGPTATPTFRVPDLSVA